MSNLACVESTTFVGKNGEKNYGALVYDDYANTFLQFEFAIEDDMDLLKMVNKSENDIVQAIISHVKEHEKGIKISGIYYDWDKISHIFSSKDEKANV